MRIIPTNQICIRIKQSSWKSVWQQKQPLHAEMSRPICFLLDFISGPLAGPGVMEMIEMYAAPFLEHNTQFCICCIVDCLSVNAHNCDAMIWYSLCPTFMVIFIDLVLHTPPSWLSMPSMVPLDVATDGKREKHKVRISCHSEYVEVHRCVAKNGLRLALKKIRKFQKTIELLGAFYWERIWLISPNKSPIGLFITTYAPLWLNI